MLLSLVRLLALCANGLGSPSFISTMCCWPQVGSVIFIIDTLKNNIRETTRLRGFVADTAHGLVDACYRCAIRCAINLAMTVWLAMCRFSSM